MLMMTRRRLTLAALAVLLSAMICPEVSAYPRYGHECGECHSPALRKNGITAKGGALLPKGKRTKASGSEESSPTKELSLKEGTSEQATSATRAKSRTATGSARNRRAMRRDSL